MREVTRRWEAEGLPLVRAAGKILILGHVHPDGDCVGSCLGLWNYLKKIRPEAEVQVRLENCPAEFAFLPGADRISFDFSEEKAYDLCMCLDAGDALRLGDAVRYLKSASRSICLDHHVTNKGFCDINVVEPHASSTSEVLAEYLDPEQMNKDIADCLYLGIIHDTGVFKYDCTSEKTMCLAGRLISLGVDTRQMIDDTFYRKSFVQNRLMGAALLKARLLCGGRMIASFLSAAEFRQYEATPANTEGIVAQLKLTAGTEVAMFLYETAPGLYKISLRSESVVDVSRIAAQYGGGGHVRASGGRFEGDPEEVIAQVAEAVSLQL